MSQLATEQLAVWAASLLAQLYLTYIITRNRIWRHFPVFSFYFILNFFVGMSLLLIYVRWGTQSRQGWSFYWALQGVIIFIRILVGIEVYVKVLRAYSGIWLLAVRVLAAVGISGLVLAAVRTFAQQPSLSTFFYLAERHLEFASALTLLAFLLFCRYYHVPLPPTLRAIAVGLCFFSIIQVLNDTLLNYGLNRYVPWWRWAMVVSFELTLVIWWLGLRVWDAAVERPVLYPAGVYEEFSPQVNYRLRLLNERLVELLKP